MDNNKITVTPNIKKAVHALRNIEESKAREFVSLVERVHQPNPDPKDVEELRTWLAKYPEVWTIVFDMSYVVEHNLIKQIAPTPASHLALEKSVDDLRHSLGCEEASALEITLIDNIIVSWLRCQWAEYRLLMFVGQDQVDAATITFWEKRLSLNQGRYLRACETLAKIRKLAQKNPLLQVNIATQSGQQVNVAGDLVKK